MFEQSLKKALQDNKIPEKTGKITLSFYENFKKVYEQYKMPIQELDNRFTQLLEMVIQEVENPFPFTPYHQKVRSPIDFYQFGLELFRPLIDQKKSKILHPENIDKMEKQIKLKENIILFANHQTEADPQLISLALEKTHPRFGEEIIFVAGDRVTTDPMAVPLSKGRNLLCIYSKKRMDSPPEKREEKLLHNRRTMHLLKELLSEGGKAIYVAPSGGRDRRNAEGEVEVASFDPQSIEMLRLMAKESEKATHFYPLALATFDILPPPPSIDSEIGEERHPNRAGIAFSFGNEIDMDKFPGSEETDRHKKREERALYIWNLVKRDYENLLK